MDKNFVNIDNLVRQRLGGGEEQERSGSWAKMNALLDKEMPTERTGFGWRGFFGAVALLLFVGTAGVGGYKLATSGRGADAQGANTQLADAGTLPAGSGDGTQRVVTTPGMEHALNTRSSSNTTGDTRTASVNTPLTAANTSSMPAATDNAHNANVANNATHANNSANTTTADHSATHNRTADVNTTTPAGNSRANHNDAAATSEAAKHNTASPADSRTAAVAAHNNATEAANATTHVPASNNRHNTASSAETNNTTAASRTAASNKATGNNNRGADVNVNKMAVGSNTPAGKPNTTDVKTAAVGTNATVGTANNTDADANVPVFVTKSGKRIPGDKLQKLNFDKAKQSEHKQTVAVAEAPKNKRVIQKMAIVERYVKTEGGEVVHKLDTVSITTLTEELGIITEKQVVPPPARKMQGEADADSKNKGMMTTHGKKSGRVKHSAAMGAFNSEKAEANSINNGSNKKTGAITLESINAAFNDVKYHMSCARFSGGITGGINSAFFGPTSLKGFQLGLLGDLIVSERVSVSGELKYFNRMSGGSSVDDNYYKYTPNGNGGYTKEMQVNAYSFSTVHSFEMPVSVRFTQGKLNLFAGGNLAYSIGVNTGAVTSADPKSRTTVNQIANDNAPTISYKDFGSRLGIGYLFGASYQVSPRLSLDLRNVQTVWDNAKTNGAKAVSSQLYKNPSLQFSIGYRFGCRKKD